MAIKKYTKEELKKLKDQTEYERLDEMSEEEIEEGSKSDPDSLTPTNDDLSKFKKVKKDETDWNRVMKSSQNSDDLAASKDSENPVLSGKKFTKPEKCRDK